MQKYGFLLWKKNPFSARKRINIERPLEEYRKLLRDFGVPVDGRYVWD
jgi:hypothetical protein